MVSHSKYYYDYTRNMSEEQIKNSPCGKPVCHCCNGSSECPHEVCECNNTIGLDILIEQLEACEKEDCENDPKYCSDC